MKKSEWSEEQLEALLKQLPTLQDTRPSYEFYSNISRNMNTYHHRRYIKLFPGIAALSALLIVLLLFPNFLYSKHDPVELKKNATKLQSAAPSASENEQLIKMDVKSVANSGLPRNSAMKTAVYDDEVGDGKVLTYWIPDPQAQILVPVSAIVSHPGKKTWIQLFNEKMPRLNEKAWGLTDYYPLRAKLQLDQKARRVIVDVPKDHPYGQGSTAETVFISALKENVSSNSNFKKIEFTTDGKPGITLGNHGVQKTMDVSINRHKAYFFYTPKKDSVPFLVPSLDSFSSLDAALAAMHQDNPNLGLNASLPSMLQFKFITIKGRTLYLRVTGSQSLVNNAITAHSYEAILLTAKEFGFERVKFENVSLKKLGPFDLSKENKVPVAANLRQIEDQS